jgi:phosphatidate phosphatase PAH1
VVPGILTSLGDGYQADVSLMEKMVQLNRSLGFKGEVFFYYETINRIPFSLYKD